MCAAYHNVCMSWVLCADLRKFNCFYRFLHLIKCDGEESVDFGVELALTSALSTRVTKVISFSRYN